ncbi:hypothetical protein PAEPH01_1762 [Pancytospora epiphaga]|nr:hypothetical protein PAEPH01_1762 [Pancytospora epiphaga]
MPVVDSDSDDLIIIETTIESPQEPVTTRKTRVGNNTGNKRQTRQETSKKRRQSISSAIVDSPASEPAKRHSTGLRVKSIVLSGQRNSISDKVEPDDSTGQTNENEENKSTVISELPSEKIQVSTEEMNNDADFVHNVMVGSVASDCMKHSTALISAICPAIDTCTINHGQDDKEAIREKNLGFGAINRLRRLLSIGPDTKCIPIFNDPIFVSNASNDSIIKNIKLKRSSGTPKESSFMQHKIICLADYVMTLYKMKEVIATEKMEELVNCAVDECNQLNGFIETINNFFEEVHNNFPMDQTDNFTGPLYIYHSKGQEVKLKYILHCLITPLLSWHRSEPLDGSSLLKACPIQPFNVFSFFTAFFLDFVNVKQNFDELSKAMLPYEDTLPQICNSFRDIRKKIDAIIPEAVALINQGIEFIWNDASIIYDCFLPGGRKERIPALHIDKLSFKYDKIMNSFVKLSAPKFRSLINLINENIRFVRKTLKESKKHSVDKQESIRIAYEDINENVCKVIFKYNDATVKEWMIGLDDGLDRVFRDLFGDDIQRKLYCEGKKVSRNLTARENGFFAGINYVMLDEEDKLPFKIPAGITIQVETDASKNICVPAAEVETVRNLIDRVKKEIGNTDEYCLIFNGLLLDDTAKIAGTIEDGDVLDAVSVSMCNSE